MVYKFFDKKTKGSVVTLANKSAIKSIPQTIWAADLPDMQLISKFNKEFKFLLCAIDIYSKYAWVVPLKDKKGVSIVNAFQRILKKSNRKPNKL